MHQARNPLTAAARAAALALAGLALSLPSCGIPEAKRAEPSRVHPDMGRVALKIVHVAGPRLEAGDPASKRRLEEAVGVASAVLGLDAIVFGGDIIANDAVQSARESLDVFASLAGIVAAPRFVVAGERERRGALPEADVLRFLDRHKLIPDRTATYGAAIRPGVRLVVLDVGLDGAVAPEARLALEKALGAAKEPIILLAADQPPLDTKVQDLLRRDERVKVFLYRAAQARVSEGAGEPIAIATPALDSPAAPAIRLVAIDGNTLKARLLAVPGGEVVAETAATLRPGPTRK